MHAIQRKTAQVDHCTQAHRFIYTNIVCITIAYQEFVIYFFFYLYVKYRTIRFKNASQLRKSTDKLKVQKGICLIKMYCESEMVVNHIKPGH